MTSPHASHNHLRSKLPHIAIAVCHGTRRDFEQTKFASQPGRPVIGLEVSDIATIVPNPVRWDFHDLVPEWHCAQGKFARRTFVITRADAQ